LSWKYLPLLFLLTQNKHADFNAVFAAFYSICTGEKKSAGLYVLELQKNVFPLVWKAKRELSNHVAISKAEKFFSDG